MQVRYLTIAALLSSPAFAGPSPTPAQVLPIAHVSFDGPALSFDLSNVQIGVAEYEDGPTGTTVIYFPKAVEAVVDVRGGAPGTLNTDALRLGYDERDRKSVV